MIGARLDRFAQRVVRTDTYAAIVAPAIADLQYEARLGAWPRVRGYAGALRALAAALLGEVGLDCWAVVRTGSALSAAGTSVLTLVCVVIPQVTLLSWYFRPQRTWHHDLVMNALWLPAFMYVAVPAAILPAAATLGTSVHPGARRASAVLAWLMGVGLAMAVWTLGYASADLRRDYSLAIEFAQKDPVLRSRPVWELRAAYNDRIEAFAARMRAYGQSWGRRPSDPRWKHTTGAFLLMLLACATIGAQFGGIRRWKIIGFAGVAFALQVAVMSALSLLYISWIYGTAVVIWVPSVLFFLVACLVALRSNSVRA